MPVGGPAPSRSRAARNCAVNRALRRTSSCSEPERRGWTAGRTRAEEFLDEEEPAMEADMAMESVASPAVRESKAMRQGYRGPGDSLGRLDGISASNAPASPRFRKLAAKAAGGSPYVYDAFGGLFPSPGTVRAPDPAWTWPEEIRSLLQSLDRRGHIAASQGGWRFDVRSRSTDSRGRESEASGQHLIGPDSWVTLATHVAGQVYGVEWVRGDERGFLLEGWRLGRVRPREEADGESWPAPFAWHFGDRLRSFAAYQAELVERADGRARIHLSMPADAKNVLELVIDVERAVLLEQSWLIDGERAHGERFKDHVQVGGTWWPQTVENWNRDRAAPSLTHIAVQALEPAALAALVTSELERRTDAILLGPEDIEVADAKQAVASDEAGLDERWALLRHYAATQRWDLALEHLDAIRALEAEKPGLAPIRLTYLRQERRREELRLLLQEESRGLVEQAGEAEYGLALQLLQFTGELNPGNETLAALEDLQPVFQRHAAIVDAELPWVERHLQALAQLSRPEEAARRPAERGRALAARGAPAGRVWRSARSRAPDRRGPGVARSFRTRIRSVEPVGAGAAAQGARPNLVERLSAWRNWSSSSRIGSASQRPRSIRISTPGCSQALVYLDREEAAQRYVDAWLAHAASPERDEAQEAQLHAAIQHALGQGLSALPPAPVRHARRDPGPGRPHPARARRRGLSGGLDSCRTGAFGPPTPDRRCSRSCTKRSCASSRACLRCACRSPSHGSAALASSRRRAKPLGKPSCCASSIDGWRAKTNRAGQPWLRSCRPGAITSCAVRYLRCVLAQAEGESARVAAVAALFGQLLQSEWSQEVLDELVSLVHAWHSTEDEPAQPFGLPNRAQQRIVALFDLVQWTVTSRSQSLVPPTPRFRIPRPPQPGALQPRGTRGFAALRGRALGFPRDVLAAGRTAHVGEPRSPLPLRRKAGRKLAELWPAARTLARREVTSLVGQAQPDEVRIELRIRAARAVATCGLPDRVRAPRCFGRALAGSARHPHRLGEGRLVPARWPGVDP